MNTFGHLQPQHRLGRAAIFLAASVGLCAPGFTAEAVKPGFYAYPIKGPIVFHQSCKIRDINDLGQTVGSTYFSHTSYSEGFSTTGPLAAPVRLTAPDLNAMQTIPYSVNNHSEMVGLLNFESPEAPLASFYRSSAGEISIIPNDGAGSVENEYALQITDSGWVIGYAERADSEGSYIKSPTSAVAHVLPVEYVVNSINEIGQVTGFVKLGDPVFWWGGPTDLLVSDPGGVNLRAQPIAGSDNVKGMVILDSGAIAGNGKRGGKSAAFAAAPDGTAWRLYSRANMNRANPLAADATGRLAGKYFTLERPFRPLAFVATANGKIADLNHLLLNAIDPNHYLQSVVAVNAHGQMAVQAGVEGWPTFEGRCYIVCPTENCVVAGK